MKSAKEKTPEAWPRWELRQLEREMAAGEMSYTEIAKFHPGRTPGSIQNKAHKCGFEYVYKKNVTYAQLFRVKDKHVPKLKLITHEWRHTRSGKPVSYA